MLVLNSLLKNNVVLQAEKKHLISGQTVPYKIVTLCMSGEIYTTKSSQDGEFIFEITPQPYNKQVTITISCEYQSLEIFVQYGDVFLFAGQSNMEYYMQNETHFLEELDKVIDDEIYFYTVPQIEYEDKINISDINSQWVKLDKSTLKDISAIAYYVVKEYRCYHPNRIIGVVCCSKGGTSASCWISQEYAQGNNPINKEIIVPFQEITMNRSKEDFDLELKAYWQESAKYYQKRAQLLDTYPKQSMAEIKKQIGHSPWPPPANPYLFTRPCGLYYTMFKKIVPYTFSSIIWYQGEEDTIYGNLYYELLKLLIAQWRSDLKENIPFYIVQLPVCKDRENHDWVSVRKAQEIIVNEVTNTYLITSLDCGELDDIHPKEKSILGKRIFEIMNNVYYPTSPVAYVKKWNTKELIIECNNTKELKLLQKDIFKCNSKIESIVVKENQLYFYSNEKIDTISYGFSNAFLVGLYNEVGYPVAPFKFCWSIYSKNNN